MSQTVGVFVDVWIILTNKMDLQAMTFIELNIGKMIIHYRSFKSSDITRQEKSALFVLLFDYQHEKV